MLKTRVAVFVSGGGSNLQAILNDAHEGKIPHGEVSLVISSTPSAYALTRAEQFGVPTSVVVRKEFDTQEAYEDKLIETLRSYGIDLIVLAGFMSILSDRFTSAYERKIINVHPSLIPSFCGKGYYGLKVHEAALDYGVKVTGATVHYVNEVPDGGEIILQKSVRVYPDDTPSILQRRVMEEAEWILLPRAVELISFRLQEEKK